MPLKKPILFKLLIVGVLIAAGVWLARYFYEQVQMAKIIERLQADSRAAEVLVTGVNYNEGLKRNFTTIKFLEYDVKGNPLSPRYLTFPGNIIQFQSLVVRFDDQFVAAGDRLKGKSVYLFWKAFMLDGERTKEFPITYLHEVPGGYQVQGVSGGIQRRFWERFWDYAFDQQRAQRAGVKNVQIEAPGAMFVPGYLYTIKIEHDGGLRIDTKPLPVILHGEKIGPNF